MLLALAAPLSAAADPSESKAVVEKAADGSEHAEVMAPISDTTRVGWKADTAADSRSQDAILQVEKDILSGTFKLDLGTHWGDDIATTHSLGMDYKVGPADGTAVELKGNTDVTNSTCAYNLKFNLNQAVTPRLSIVGGINATNQLTGTPDTITSLGFGYKLGEQKDSLISLGVDRDSDGLFEITTSVKKKFRKWGTLKLEAVRRMQQDPEMYYRAGYTYDVTDRFSLGAEADVKPVANETPDIGVRANLRVNW